MLKSLKIKNIAIISECTIEFGQGFNVLSGETGAGKSIIIDSLEFVLGARADKSLIKAGTEQASVTAVFDVSGVACKDELFNILALPSDDMLVISRTMNVMGKNECRVNGELTSLSLLKKATSALVDIFGQHDSVALLDVNNHLTLLDSVNEGAVQPLKDAVVNYLAQIKGIDDEIQSLGGLGDERERNIDILKYQIKEIDGANLQLDELDTLNAKLNKLKNSEKIAQLLSDGLALIDGDYSVCSALKSANFNIEALANYDDSFNELSKRVQSAKYELEDIIDTLRSEQNNIGYSESEINSVIDRLEFIKDICRKYGKTIADVIAYKQDAELKLDKLINADQSIANLTKQKSEVVKGLTHKCVELTNVRKDIASALSVSVENELHELGMKNAKFEVKFGNYDTDNILQHVSASGADSVEFMFSANLKVPVAPLSKIISGGEMSRFMLAFKCVTGGNDKTYVFDEIDAGIGGDTGTVVAKKLSKISHLSQVLCVTHLAQIAAFGDVNYLIEKTEIGETATHVKKLDESGKRDEITRMIGSVNNNSFAHQHAVELIKEANAIKLNNI